MQPCKKEYVRQEVAEIAARRYDAYLFFDIELGQNAEFTKISVEVASASNFENCSFTIYSAQTRELLGGCLPGCDPDEIFSFMQGIVARGEVSLGIVLVGGDAAWYIVQESPVSLGVIGLSRDSLARASADIIESNFVSCEQIANWSPEMVSNFDLVYGFGSHTGIIRRYCSEP